MNRAAETTCSSRRDVRRQGDPAGEHPLRFGWVILAVSALSLAVSAVPAAASNSGLEGAHQYGRSLFAVDGTATDDVWAVGLTAEDGTAIWHRDGSGWTAVSHPGSATPAVFRGIDARGAKDVWAVGSRDDLSSGLQASYAQRWNGSRWHVVAADPGLATSEANAVDALAADDAWLVGDATKTPAGYVSGLIERWDGSSWTAVPGTRRGSGCDASLEDVAAVAENDVWTVGEEYCDGVSTALVERWDGQRWARVDVPSPKGATFVVLQGVTVIGPNDVWAVGASSRDSLTPGKNLTMHWNGVRWKLVTAPSPGAACDHFLSGVSGSGADDVWAAGSRSCQGGVTPEMLHWDGTGWTKVPCPTPGFTDPPADGLYGVVSLSKRSAFTVGIAKTNGQSLEVGFIERWNGSGWSLQ